jgi:hypothetical protein
MNENYNSDSGVDSRPVFSHPSLLSDRISNDGAKLK